MSEVGDRTRIVVGLGNPGRRYAGTRHNMGFEVIDLLCRRRGLGPGRHAFGGLLTEWGQAAGGRVILLKPHTFMNSSGRAAGEIARFYKAGPQNLLVVLDDLALPLGQLRARAGGSSGGHNGLSDVLRALGTDQVPRLRIGIGPRPEAADAMDFVLHPFAADERAAIERALPRAAQAVEDWAARGIEFVMSQYNQKPTDDQPSKVERDP